MSNNIDDIKQENSELKELYHQLEKKYLKLQKELKEIKEKKNGPKNYIPGPPINDTSFRGF